MPTIWSPPPAGQRNDWEEGSTALGHHLIDFWTNICLCQSLIIEKNPEGPDNLPHVYQVCCCCLLLVLPLLLLLLPLLLLLLQPPVRLQVVTCRTHNGTMSCPACLLRRQA